MANKMRRDYMANKIVLCLRCFCSGSGDLFRVTQRRGGDLVLSGRALEEEFATNSRVVRTYQVAPLLVYLTMAVHMKSDRERARDFPSGRRVVRSGVASQRFWLMISHNYSSAAVLLLVPSYRDCLHPVPVLLLLCVARSCRAV